MIAIDNQIHLKVAKPLAVSLGAALVDAHSVFNGATSVGGTLFMLHFVARVAGEFFARVAVGKVVDGLMRDTDAFFLQIARNLTGRPLLGLD